MNNNKKGVANGSFSALIVVAVAIIIGTVIYSGVVAPNVGTMTNSVTMNNRTFTLPANGASVDLVGQELLSTPVVINQSTGVVLTSPNYTIGERVSPTDGLKRIYIKMNDAKFASQGANISYVYGAEGYVDDAGGRSITGLVAVMAALAIFAAAFYAINLKDLFG